MPSPLSETLSLFTRPDEEDDHHESPTIASFTVRSPVSELAQIDGLATYARVSRNEMANRLLAIGLAELLGSLPESVRGDVHEHISDALGDLL